MSADMELLQSYAQTRDAQAFASLVAAYGDMVYGTCLRILRNVAEAEDATQECFLRLARDSAKVHTSLGAWLHRCATNECISRVRQLSATAKRERTYEELRQDVKKGSSWTDVSDEVDRALEELPEELRQVLVGHFLQRKSQTDLAAELGVSPATMSRRINEGVEAIRKKLTRAGVTVSAVVLGVMLLQHTVQAAPPTLVASLGKMAIAGPAAIGTSGVTSGLGGGSAAHGANAAGTTSTFLAGKSLLLLAGAALLIVIALCVWSWQALNPTRAGPRQLVLVNGASKPPRAGTSVDNAAARAQSLAALSPQDRKIYELLYQLRQATPPDRPVQWLSTVRSLTEIGKPAVPAMAAELDGARRDGEQRLLLLALRAVGDPRAVPALIRAIPRLSHSLPAVELVVPDPDLRQFLDSHSWSPPENHPDNHVEFSTLNRGITLCTAALETLTNHSEGHDLVTNEPQAPGDQAAVSDDPQRERFADRWRQWWSVHVHEIVSDDELRSLRTAQIELVDPVGIAAFGPPFPTGLQLKIGPVHEAVLQPSGTWDARAYIDFDADAVYVRNQGWNNPAPADAGHWLAAAGVDAFATIDHRPGRSSLCTLQARDLIAWPVANERFNTIDKELHAATPLNLGSWGATNSLVSQTAAIELPAHQEYPVTFLFKTREGGCGILQIVRPLQDDHAMQLRYRMIDNGSAKAPALAAALKQPEPSSTNVDFGFVHDAALGAPATMDESALALASGDTRPQSVAVNDPAFTPAKRAWLESWGGDLLTLTWTNGQLCGLGADRLTALEVSPAAWDELPAAELPAYLARRDPQPPATAAYLMPDASRKMPATWIIQTRDGQRGLLQITELSADHVWLRYKLVEKTPANR